MPSGAQPNTPTRALLLLPLAALLTIHPLIVHHSCGQDLTFHIQSWLDAASQLRHVHYPHWDYTAAWNAGEPRFLFYPPLSWLLGAILTMIFPIATCPTIFIFIALLAAGLTFHKLASHFVAPNPALIASAFYLANPYMLFNAFERSALAELLAAAWIPLLLLAILRARPTIRGIALPLALLWLTNAPAAVIGSYTLALLATLRILTVAISQRREPSSPSPQAPSSRPIAHAHQTLSSRPESAHFADAAERSLHSAHAAPIALAPPTPLHLALTYLAGTLLGLTLPAFYLIPAAYERRFIQVAMAIIPNLRPQDNFLFTHTADAAHNAVNHTASTLALTLTLLTAAALITFTLLKKTSTPEKSVLSTENRVPQVSPLRPGFTEPPTLTRSHNPVISTEGRRPQRRDLQLPPHLTLLTAIIALLLTPLSTPIWQHLPELAYLQFPWRLLTLLTPLLALSLALLLDRTITDLGAPGLAFETWVRRMSTPAVLLLPLALTIICFHLYAQSCDPTDNPATLAQLFSTHHGLPPTDEYTPTPADNDLLRTDNPAYWLTPSTNPNTPAPNTTPTPTELNPNLDTDDTPVPLAQTLSTPAPHHLTLNLAQPETLILNLRAYPNWRITRTPSTPTIQLSPSAQDDRDDGLIAIALPAGPSTLNITWHRTPDQTLGLAISVLALLALALTFRARNSL